MARRKRSLSGWSRLNPSIDWSSVEERAARLSDNALFYALEDIKKTMPIAREHDRIDGGDREGWYSDEAAIYRRELNRRRAGPSESQRKLAKRFADVGIGEESRRKDLLDYASRRR